MKVARCLLAVALVALPACRTPTYDERMADVDHLYSRGDFEAAAAELDKVTKGRISGEEEKENDDGDPEE